MAGGILIVAALPGCDGGGGSDPPERLAELQEEILWICEARHVPVIRATQVLESLSKKGMPTRAEISDAAMAEQVECVMQEEPAPARAAGLADGGLGDLMS